MYEEGRHWPLPAVHNIASLPCPYSSALLELSSIGRPSSDNVDLSVSQGARENTRDDGIVTRV